ncbi:MAG: helix-turn-helix domain-containing protein [Actinomycetota bacterium]
MGTGTLRKPAEYKAARKLRQEQGMPYKRIAAALGISPSTAFGWTRDIELTQEQMQHNLFGPRGPQNPDHIRRRVESWKQASRDKAPLPRGGARDSPPLAPASYGGLHALLG